MTELNDSQKVFVNKMDGMMVVDAGPGTGKTTSVVERYVNFIKNDIDPMNILMLTFTNNAALEMKNRIIESLMNNESGNSLQKLSNNIRVSTFDSLCLNIVMDCPNAVGDFFGLKESLSRNMKLVENETLDVQYFMNFYARYIADHGERYQTDKYNPAAVMSNNTRDLYNLICKLMSRGVIPLRYEWFGKGERIVKGNVQTVSKKLLDNKDIVKSKLIKLPAEKKEYCFQDIDLASIDENIEEIIESIADEDRKMMLEFIRDIYFGYIERSIIDNRLTFGLCELFAFAVLFSDSKSRSMHSVDYMMVDEFQDTNELQMKICLLLLKKPNLCVVGDWKQGIYGFRFVSEKNITEFEDRADRFITELKKDVDIPFDMPDVLSLEFTENYRSSSLIIGKPGEKGKVFESLMIKGSKDDEITNGKIVELIPKRDDEIGENTEFKLLKAKDRDDEIDTVVKKIIDYITNPKYKIVKNGEERNVRFNDIAVLCRGSKICISILEKCVSSHIPAFYQGEMEIMSTREGKLALAWLRYVNNPNDKRGCVAILVDRGYSLSKIRSMLRKKKDSNDEYIVMPLNIKDYRDKIENKKRRPNDLLTSIFAFYGLDNEITQSIINVLSSAYSNSLLTLSDLIRLIEDDIENGTKYEVEPSLDTEAVTIQTMHKSKGLQYPIVIIADVNSRKFPDTKGEKSVIKFDDELGIRCKKEYVINENDGIKNEGIMDSWRYEILSELKSKDYSEERRLLFVALSRAEQYVTMTAYNPSSFFKHFGDGEPIGKVKSMSESYAEQRISLMPELLEFEKKRNSLSPHDIMAVYDGYTDEEIKGKGAEYGNRVHEAAYKMWKGLPYDDSLDEIDEIRSVLDSVKDAETMAEVRCVLPIGNTSVKGIIDLIAVFDDHVEIHDYKTDETQKNKQAYVLQLSIYAQAAKEMYSKPVVAYIDYVSQKVREKINIMTNDEIEEKIKEYYDKVSKGLIHP